jgi:predicted ArsR family transcriptional regulator
MARTSGNRTQSPAAADIQAKKKPWLSREPSAFQERILRVLRDSGTPLSSAELSTKVGLVSNEARGYCLWLEDNQFVERRKRNVRRVVVGRMRTRPEIFWKVTEKALGYLATRDARADPPAATSVPAAGGLTSTDR